MLSKSGALIFLVLLLSVQGRIKKTGTRNPRRNASSNTGLWPSPFNLATKALITANATCGENGREEFCRMVEKTRCGFCDGDSGKKHLISYAIDGSNRWWQSPALFYGQKYEHVTVELDLKQVYQIKEITLKAAHSLRPGAWILERSIDGISYQAWEYFGRSDKECLERFGLVGTKGKPHYFTDTEVICTSYFSKLVPMENGEIHVSLVDGRPGANETSPELLEFTKARFVRLRFMGLRGTMEPVPRWLLQDNLREKKLYYTIRDISVMGYCACNGHAENCRHNVASGHPECECSHHTCGPHCNRCCPMYNQRTWAPATSRDAHQCLPCNCHGHAASCHYDEQVDKAGKSLDIDGNYQGGGVCDNCTAHTSGVNCEKCLEGYYRAPGVEIFAAEPCLRCDCQVPGSTGSCIQEGELAGNCVCKAGFEGRKCDRCAEGYRGWPGCEACPCDSRGVLEGSVGCEGSCECKVNVYGKYCDSCKTGYFSLKTENPGGCTRCHCSGVTTVCESAMIQPPQIQTLENWFITDFNVTDVVKPIWDSKGLFSIGSYELANSGSLFWLAPNLYLGNKLQYYGSTFLFKVHWVIMRGDTSGWATTGPNIILAGKDGTKIGHGSDFYTTSNETFSILLKEQNWYKIEDDPNTVGIAVTRQEFLQILTNIGSIHLRATFHTDQIESLLEEATLVPSNGEDVEQCFCPSGYSGLSCENCAFGYVRITTNTSQSYCGKCDCNGHSETCNPDTGECLCLHHTTGENCERCKAGFYGNPLRGTENDCKKCACPLENEENNFSPSCQVDYQGDEGIERYVCTQCPKGYTGDHCEICDDGHFGNPQEPGSTCQLCNCNGGPCDKKTGQCLSCKGNTEGWKCDRCKTGYYGNALISNCMSCQCDTLGAVTQKCDTESGQCECKDRFTGRTCSKCQLGYGNVTAGCVLCACNLTGSQTDFCDQQTGLCKCKDGIDGFYCDSCQNGHFSFSDEGCKECMCDPNGSKIQACDQNTGKCICKPNYEGDKCDRCKAGFWKDNSICVPCDCNPEGSFSQNCDRYTGTCPCKAGVTGIKCNSCKKNFFGDISQGCQECEPCNKEGHICNQQTGKCTCPNLTSGSKCENCVEGSWDYEPGLGCKSCECSPQGSTSKQCDSVTGRCTCRLGYEGEKCNKCSFGHFGYPNCRRCDCVIAGTRPEQCNGNVCQCSEQGCKCKGNVEGQRCEKCKKGTFGLDAQHPLGCVECFCSGRSSICSESSVIWDQIRTDKVEQIEDCVNLDHLCWQLPEKFLGSLIRSYGGYLRISSSSKHHLVYVRGNNVTIESVTDPRGDIKLTETFWKLKFGGTVLPTECSRRLTRPCLMVVFANVDRIQVEVNSKFTLKEILLDTTSSTSGLALARTVEQCSCPKEYTSSSCQDPNKGYYRYYPTKSETKYNFIDRTLGVAKPCHCNNHSDNCDKKTGHCIDCKDFTSGIHCEICAEGYYKDNKGSCSSCPCPNNNQNFAKNCTRSHRQKFVCFCKEGYAGANCDRCEDFYWGHPLEKGGSCKPCDCNPYGSLDLNCGKSDGLCRCKSGFTGDKCNKCSSPRHVISSGICLPCDECTQILFYTIDELSLGLNEALKLFKNGVGPPWGIFNNTLHKYEELYKLLNDAENVEQLINNSEIDKLKNRVEHLRKLVQKQQQNVDETGEKSVRMHTESLKIKDSVEDIDNRIVVFADKIKNFGQSHVDVNDALGQAQQLYDDIVTISQETPITQYQQSFDKCNRFYQSVLNHYPDGLNTSALRQQLSDLRAKTADLNEELDETFETNELVKNKNKRNTRRLSELRGKINKIDVDHSTIQQNLVDHLDRINATHLILTDLKGIYQALKNLSVEEQAASLNGEEEEAIIKLSTIGDHVKDLQERIKIYKRLFNFTSEEWTKIDASGAYDNIVKEIKRAEDLAEDAKKLMNDVKAKLYPLGEDSLMDRTYLADAASDRIKQRVTNLESLTKDFANLTDRLEDLKHDILGNGKTNNDLNAFLHMIIANLTNQEKLFKKLNHVKVEARNISNLVAEIEQRLKDLNITAQYDLVKKYQKYLQLVSSDVIKNLKSNIANTTNQLNNIQIKLETTNLDKITDTNTFLSNNSNLDNIRTQIRSLSHAVTYASQRVEMVNFGVDIRECERSYKVQSTVFQRLELNFECVECDLIKLYNSKNETLKISFAGNEIHVDWKGTTRSVLANTSLVMEKTGSKIIIKTDKADASPIFDNQPFVINEGVRLFVGTLERQSSKACLRKVRLNDQNIGLWKFYTSQGNCPGCKNIGTDSLVNVFFKGKGYRQLTTKTVDTYNPIFFNFRFGFATFDDNSLLFLAKGPNSHSECSYLALSLQNRRLVFTIKFKSHKVINLSTEKLYNTGTDTVVDLSLSVEDYDRTSPHINANLALAVLSGDEKLQDTIKINRTQAFKIKRSEIFFGGIPASVIDSCTPFGNISFLGNMNSTANYQNSDSVNIEPWHTKLQFTKVWFKRNGIVEMEYDSEFKSNLSFILTPASNVNNFTIKVNDMLINLEKQTLTFEYLTRKIPVEFTICSGSRYFINIKKRSISVNEDVKNLTSELVIFGDKLKMVLGHERSDFIGSISDIFVDDRSFTLNKQTLKKFKGIEIGRDYPIKPETSNECKNEMQSTERYFQVPEYQTEPQAFKFGDKPNSFLFMKNVLNGKKIILEFQFRTFYPNGLLFITNPNLNYVLLEIKSGHLRLRSQGRKMKVLNTNKRVNDGAWHQVQIEQVLGKKKWRLVVKIDKNWKIKERLQKNSFSGNVYLGDVPDDITVHKKLTNELNPFRGCIRFLKINKNVQVVQNNNNISYNNIGQCFKKVEEGAYFGGDAYAIYKSSFKVDKFLELSFEFKTGHPNGILLSVSDSNNSPALSVELQNGAVVMTVDMGNRIVSKVTNSPNYANGSSLANKHWHNITALYSSLELTVNVDGIRKSWVQSDIGVMEKIEAPLYIGGLPSTAPTGTLEIKENFRGCIRRFKIEENIMDWTDMKELNNVQLNSCLT